MSKQQRRGFLAGFCITAAYTLLAPHHVHATEITICNEGDVPFSVATATRQGDGLFVPRSWYLEGWFKVPVDDCSGFPDHTDQPIYVAIGFRDAADEWGAAEFTTGRENSSWRRVETDICVADGAFGYSWDDERLAGACDYGYFHFPAALYLEPSEYTSEYTLRLSIDEDSLSIPPQEHTSSNGDSSREGHSYEGGKSFGDKLWDGFWQAVDDAAAREAEKNAGVRDATDFGPEPVDASPGPSVDAAPAAPEAPPHPYEPGTLTAMLFQQPIVRRVDGSGEWYNADGVRVDALWQLDGLRIDDILDPPTQHAPGDAEVAAAQQRLDAGLTGFDANRGAQVTPEGRLYYTYASDVGVRHDSASLVALDLEYAKPLTDAENYTGILISCRKFDPCVVAWGEDAAGKPSGTELYSAVRIFAANAAQRDEVLAALRELKRLYPAEPAVTER
jgi:hypothetical protein